MIRFVVFLIVGVCAGMVPLAHRQVEQASDEIELLQQERLDVLNERVETIKGWFKKDRADLFMVVQAEVDLLDAKLEYCAKDERVALLDEMLSQYDKLIELAEMMAIMADRPGNQPNDRAIADAKLLHIKSEKIRFQILCSSEN